jgi:hypothetical protein
MTVFDLLFVAVSLGTIAAVVWILLTALRGYRAKALGSFLTLLSFLAAYLSIVVVVSLLTPRKELRPGEDQCFDDWCISVEGVAFSNTAGRGSVQMQAKGRYYFVTLRVSSRALGRAQAAPDAAVYLLDDRDRVYQPSAEGQRAFESLNGKSLPLGMRLQPGASFRSVTVFDVPKDAAGIGLVVAHGGWPGRFIVGDSNSLFHKKTVTLLPEPAHSGAIQGKSKSP